MPKQRRAATTLASLERRKKALLTSLPPFTEILRGSFFEREIRCGKPSCRCASGTGHPVCYVGVTFPGGRTEQVTVPRDLAPIARRWVANYQRWWRAIERVSEHNRRLLRERLVASVQPASTRRQRGGGPRRGPRGRGAAPSRGGHG